MDSKVRVINTLIIRALVALCICSRVYKNSKDLSTKENKIDIFNMSILEKIVKFDKTLFSPKFNDFYQN